MTAQELDDRFEQLERKLRSHDQTLVGILNAIRELARPQIPQRRPIGFTADLDGNRPGCDW